ncbi:hypothetical protein GF402_01365 [Candidatus Fermentibacteria bacterium]|nr:hypothetical protein [Candidatus Fermentibacteria bacterium]
MQVGRMVRQFLMKPWELHKAGEIDVSGIETVGILLGPYRNLTTLTAGMLALHPHCQVLNHAGMRILPWRMLNIFRDWTPEKMERFKRYAVYISGRGQRGDYGGSITYSHAFTREPLAGLCRERYGDRLVKREIRSLVWKESLRVANAMRRWNVDIDRLLSDAPELRFILPVRNPLDTARSNLRTGKTAAFQGLEDAPGLEQTVTAVLEELLWFARLARGREKNFFHYFQHSWSGDTAERLASFLGLKPDPRWVDDSRKAFRVGGGYEYTRAQLEHYLHEVDRLFDRFPDFRKNLRAFTGEGQR